MKAYSNWRSYIIFLAGISISALIAWNIGTLHEDSIRVQIKGEMKELSYRVSRELFVNFEAMHIIQGLFQGSQNVTKAEFSRVAGDTLERHPELSYLQWAPRVKDTERDVFEQAQQQIYGRYAIQQRSSRGRWVRADQRPEYFPVTYQADRGFADLRVGVDLNSEIYGAALIRQAERASGLSVSGPLKDEATGDLPHILAVLPVSETDNAPLTGVVAARFTIERLMHNTLSGGNTGGLHVALIDLTTLSESGSEGAVLFAHQPVSKPALDMQQRYMIPDVGGRNWQLVVAPSESYLNERKSELSYIVMMAGLMLSGLITAYLRMQARRSIEIHSVAEQRNQALQEANKQLAHLSQTDGLTQIANRRFFDSSLVQEWKRSKREQQPISLVLFDLDFFKQYNDQYGHLQGDECLRTISELVASVINRPGDLFARFGGEEFILLLPNTPHEGALNIAEQCRELVASLAMPHHHSEISEVVTISVGVCTLTPEGAMTEHELLDLTDQALYCAKDRGRNTVVSANREGFSPREEHKLRQH